MSRQPNRAAPLLVIGSVLGVLAHAPSTDGNDLAGRYRTAIQYQHAYPNRALAAWREQVPKIRRIAIPSSRDGVVQRALWYDSGSTRKKPLLVALHSWSADYRQNLGIPFAQLAVERDWLFLHPDFRGPNRRPEATASDLAVRDVLDAVDDARKRAAVDPARIYLVGYSGGAMKALVLAGRHPEIWAAVAAWGAIYDIGDWFRHCGRHPRYQREIAASCGGSPDPGSTAEKECHRRSPAADLAHAAGRVAVLIAHGIADGTVPPSHAVRAYDDLARAEDRFSDEQRIFIDRRAAVPRELGPFTRLRDPFFDRARAPILLERRSRSATLILYQGGHDMLYEATVEWLRHKKRGPHRHRQPQRSARSPE